MRNPAKSTTMNRAITKSAPIRPSSSPMMEKMKSVSCFGQIQKLLPRIAQADTEDAAFGKGVKRPDHLIPSAVAPFAVVPRVQPYADAVGAVARQADNAHDPDYDNQRNKALHGSAKPHRRKNAYENDSRRAHVGLSLYKNATGKTTSTTDETIACFVSVNSLRKS